MMHKCKFSKALNIETVICNIQIDIAICTSFLHQLCRHVKVRTLCVCAHVNRNSGCVLSVKMDPLAVHQLRYEEWSGGSGQVGVVGWEWLGGSGWVGVVGWEWLAGSGWVEVAYISSEQLSGLSIRYPLTKLGKSSWLGNVAYG